MAFVPVTISTSTINAAGIDTNLSNMRKYINGQMVAGDLDTDWVKSHHLMAGKYNNINNTMEFISGIQGGKVRTAPRQLMTFSSRFNTFRNDSNGTMSFEDAQFEFVPNTTIMLTVNVPLSALMIHFHMISIHEDVTKNTSVANMGTGQALLQVVMSPEPLDSAVINKRSDTGGARIRKPFLPLWSVEENMQAITATGPGTTTSRAHRCKRFPKAGTFMKPNCPAGTWRLGLIGKNSSSKLKIVHWSVTVEGWL
tara:strand:+ start:4492 stop:5253 length:762 start_codon:yes stop_codon:yes gene_type:complete